MRRKTMLGKQVKNSSRQDRADQINNNLQEHMQITFILPQPHQVLPISNGIHQHDEPIKDAKEKTKSSTRHQHMSLSLQCCCVQPAGSIEIFYEFFWEGPLFFVYVIEYYWGQESQDVAYNCYDQFFYLVMFHEHAPKQKIQIFLVYILVENQEYLPQGQPKQDLICTMNTKVHSGQRYHNTKNQQYKAPNSKSSIAQGIRYNGLVQHTNCKAMATWIPEIPGAEPFPFLYFLAGPNRSRLLEGLLQQSHYVCCQQEIRQVDHEQQLAIDNYVIKNKHSSYSYWIAQQRKYILNKVQKIVVLILLIVIYEVYAQQKQWGLVQCIDANNYTQKQSAAKKNCIGKPHWYFVILSIIQLVLLGFFA